MLLNPETGSIGKLGPGADRPGDALDPMWTDDGRVRAEAAPITLDLASDTPVHRGPVRSVD
ncbi:hypothetical protein, partial [Gordonia sp. (in: high G+C Gram-positive bacteria)]|uniref:hypothetical protein n=1 Tax=Gordonia sp. (in: high G+C Gram-positive bacteria) TaxID=84139 RepID=UPI002BEE75A3